MRPISETDKVIIKEIIRHSSDDGRHFCRFETILEFILKEEPVFLKFENLAGKYCSTFYFDGDRYKYPNPQISIIQKRLEDKILDAFFLIEYLKDEYFLVELNREQSLKKTEFEISRKSISKHLKGDLTYGETTSKLIFRRLSKTYYIRPELKVFENNGYQTVTTIRNKKIQKATWASIILAGLLGIAGIALNILSLNRSTELSPQTIQQIDSIIQRNQGLQNAFWQSKAAVLDSNQVKVKQINNSLNSNLKK